MIDPENFTIPELEALITYHQDLYFIENRTEISDSSFDSLVKLLKLLAPDSPVLDRLG